MNKKVINNESIDSITDNSSADTQQTVLLNDTEEILESVSELEAVDISGAAVISPGRLVAKRFFRSRLSVAGLVILLFLFAFAFLGPFFSPYGETEKVNVTKEVETIFTYVAVDDVTGEKYTIYEKRIAIVSNLTPPTSQNWLGTDQFGYDVLTRLMYGGRISLLLGFMVVIAETVLGIFFGALAGYYGKWVDQVIMRIVDIFGCIPGLPLLLICGAVLESWGTPANQKIYWLMLILTIFGWGGTARLVRGQILMLREQEFMLAAEGTGLSSSRKMFKHLIPNVMPQIIVSATLGLGGVILYESTLSYLGLGVPFPLAAWGTMIGAASPSTGSGRDILQNYPNLWIPAGILIVLAVLAFNFVGDGMRDAFDPKMKR
ncbi:MAG: ABC transporter permease [Clostridia bacterium]